MQRSTSSPGAGYARRVVWLIYLSLGVLAAIVYALDLSPAADNLSSAMIGLGAVAALVAGSRWHRAQPTRPWTLLSIAAGLFLVGMLVRPEAAGRSGIEAFAGDAFTVPGYILMIIALLGLIRARGGLERHAVTDGLIVGVGAFLASVLLLAVPAASISDRSASISVMAGIYPIFDVILLLLLVNLAFTTAARQPSFLLLVARMTLLLVGDLSYAIIGVWGDLVGTDWMDLLFLLGFTAIGAAALHPSMVQLSHALPVPVQAWKWQRLVLIVPAVAVPFVLVPLVAGKSPLTDSCWPPVARRSWRC